MSTLPRDFTGPATSFGAWRAGDPVGARKFASVGPLDTEAGGHLAAVDVAYETWGELSPAADNAILVLHALTGDSHVVGDVEPGHPTPGWWQGLIGPGLAIDTNHWFVVAPNVLGGCQGTTGPVSAAPDGLPYGSRFPAVTVRDQVEVEARLADQLGIDCWGLVIGGSMGGMRALEWAVTHPERVARLALLATTAAATADQIAWCSPQLSAIRCDPAFNGGDYYGTGPGPVDGLSVARQIAHTTYRAASELNSRFGRDAQMGEDPLRGGRFSVESYLEYHAGKLTRRFDANSYLVLTESMNTHDVGRNRGGTEAALARVTARTVVAGIDSDRLFPAALNLAIASGIPGAVFEVLHSGHGHDGFLVEVGQVGALVSRLLAECSLPAS